MPVPQIRLFLIVAQPLQPPIALALLTELVFVHAIHDAGTGS